MHIAEGSGGESTENTCARKDGGRVGLQLQVSTTTVAGMKKSKSQLKRRTHFPDATVTDEVQNVLRGRLFHGDVPEELHGLEEQKRQVQDA